MLMTPIELFVGLLPFETAMTFKQVQLYYSETECKIARTSDVKI